MTMFRVGQLVVCCDDTFITRGWQNVESKPERGRIYTVRELLAPGLFYKSPDLPALRLVEIVNRKRNWGAPCVWGNNFEPVFTQDRFRPVATTDISWAHKLVADLPKSKTLIDS